MAFSVVMPALEMAQQTGKLIAWRKKEGDRVTKGEPLLEIETDKAIVEIEAPADGLLAGVKAVEGADIPVGQTIAWIVSPGEQPPFEEPSVSSSPARAVSQIKVETSKPTEVALESTPAATARISPKARRLAKELGVDIALVRGSGPGGEILASDIQASAASPTASAEQSSAVDGSIEVPSSLARIMAERTTQSWTTVPHFFVSRDVDATALNKYRDDIVDELERAHQVRITHTDLLVALVARVLLKHPRLNASWAAQGIQFHKQVHMGLAVAVNDGVVAVVIPNAHTAALADIARQRRELAERARAGKLKSADISDATFTISNLGMYHVDQFSAIITPPQAAILAVGAIADRIVAVEGKPTVQPRMTLTVSCDHRVADGAKAALFVSALAEAIAAPATQVR